MAFQFHEVSIPPQCAGGIIGRSGSNIQSLVQQVLEAYPNSKIRMKVIGSGRNTNVTVSCVDTNSNAIPFAENLIRNEVLRIRDETRIRAQKKRVWKSHQPRQPRRSRVAPEAKSQVTTNKRNQFEELDFDDDNVDTNTSVSKTTRVDSSLLGFKYGGISDLRRQHRSDVAAKRRMEVKGGAVVDGAFQPRKLTWSEFRKEKPVPKPKVLPKSNPKTLPDTLSVSEFPTVSKAKAPKAVWNINTNCSWDEPAKTEPAKNKSWADMADEADDY